MKHYNNSSRIKSLLGIVLFFAAIACYGQTNVVKMSAAKSNEYGITYFLPKTVLIVQAEFSNVSKKAGPYSKYAEKYLGITSNVVFEDQTYYTLDKVNISTKGIPNKTESYLVEFKSKTTAPFVYLTNEGIICTINAEYEPIQNTINEVNKSKSFELSSPAISPQSVYTEEYLQAGSVGKMAEVAAKQIYKLRESKMDILTGDAENTPKDGEAMKIVLQQLETNEKALTALFTGTSSQEKQVTEFEIDPKSDLEKEVIFRFSKFLGLVGNDDLSGIPVYLNLKKTDATETILTPDAKDKKEKEAKSIVYNIPGKAFAEIFYGNNPIAKGQVLITQFGHTQILGESVFEDKKSPVKIYFYPETGAIKQITQ